MWHMCYIFCLPSKPKKTLQKQNPEFCITKIGKGT